MSFKLEVATKEKAKLRMAIEGPPGGGKTYSAIKIAKHLIGEPYLLADKSKSRIALIDTERGSARLYADEFHFHSGDLSPEDWHPRKFTEALRACEKVADVVIIDSITHEWKWCLNQVEVLKPKFRGNTWSTWSEIRPPHDDFIDAIMASSAHVICTMRSKVATAQEKNDNGRVEVVQKGLEAIQEAELDYSFTVVLSMDKQNNSATVKKTRCKAINGLVFPQPGEKLAGMLLDWLNSGEDTKTERPKAPETVADTWSEIGARYEMRLAALDTFDAIDELAKLAPKELKDAPKDVRARIKCMFDAARQRVTDSIAATNAG